MLDVRRLRLLKSLMAHVDLDGRIYALNLNKSFFLTESDVTDA